MGYSLQEELTGLDNQLNEGEDAKRGLLSPRLYLYKTPSVLGLNPIIWVQSLPSSLRSSARPVEGRGLGWQGWRSLSWALPLQWVSGQ